MKALAGISKDLIRAIKPGSKKTLGAMVRVALMAVKTNIFVLIGFFKKILDTIRPQERLRKTVKKAGIYDQHDG